MSTRETRLPELWDLVWQNTVSTLWIVALVMLIGGLLGLLLGVGLYVSRPGGLYQNKVVSAVLNVLVNFFRPIPFVILIAAVQPAARAVVGTGIGNRALVFAMVVGSMFAIARIVEQNLVTVQPGVIEAARSMGASRLRILRTVALPEALGPLVLGYTFAFVAVIDMQAIASVIGGDGIGGFALQYGYRQFDTVVTWTAVVIIVVIVQLVQFGGNRLARHFLRR
ncbi:methionine ABC transporter permease [Aeromicrobium sp. IC_218]|uniref:methionine ABC transporter permease n=1 Tax=Aeromicrobium sp. IC_218 TaxID=2545468 RepID=UPI00103B14BB|nr:methionine ABC transporter permease [Aeromicrobium sp. IC_218]TCI99074.1 ABC transporter permease [Aeromicrobium sp. IC_218]